MTCTNHRRLYEDARLCLAPFEMLIYKEQQPCSSNHVVICPLGQCEIANHNGKAGK